MTTRIRVTHYPAKVSAVANRGPAPLTPAQLYRLAIGSNRPLSQNECDRVSPDHLFALALTRKLELSQRDRQRLRPLHIWHLALIGGIELSPAERSSLSVEQLQRLQTRCG